MNIIIKTINYIVTLKIILVRSKFLTMCLEPWYIWFLFISSRLCDAISLYHDNK